MTFKQLHGIKQFQIIITFFFGVTKQPTFKLIKLIYFKPNIKLFMKDKPIILEAVSIYWFHDKKKL